MKELLIATTAFFAAALLSSGAQPGPGEAALLAEGALAVDWLRPEEDAAWSHLQPGK